MPGTKENEWTTDDWIKKLKHQADDSKEYRHKLYEKVDLKNKRKILDVGCGTGAVTLDIALLTEGEVVGIDIDEEKLQEAERVLSKISNIKLMKGDVLDLPFEDDSFDLVVFNIVLMHVKKQQEAVNEMARVVQKGGFVLGTLEPDYASLMTYPENPTVPLIIESLKERGADIYAGRKLKVLLNKAGLKTEVGMDTESNFVLVKDEKKYLDMFVKDFWLLDKLLKKNKWTEEQIERYKEEEVKKIKRGLSFHFIPCFYAIGRKI